MMLGPIARGLSIAALCLGVLATLMTARSVLEARALQAEAAVALEAGDLDRAVQALRRAARWNAPGNVYARDALAALEQLGDAARARGDRALALAAYRAIHASIHAASGAFSYAPERLARADQQIAALMASEGEPGPAAGERERVRHYLSLLEGQGPHPFWVTFACFGFFAWIIAAAVFLLHGVDAKGRVVRTVARRSGFVLLLGWIAFALGLRLA